MNISENLNNNKLIYESFNQLVHQISHFKINQYSFQN